MPRSLASVMQTAPDWVIRGVVCLLAVLSFVSPAQATPITVTATATGCVARPAVKTEYAWTYLDHFQAVVFHDPRAGCDTTILEPVYSLLVYTVNYDGNGGLRVTTDSSLFPTCGRLQFDMHTYLENGILNPYGLISLVVNLGTNCADLPTPPIHPPPNPIPEPASLVLVATGIAGLWVRWRRSLVGGNRAH